MIKSDNNVVGKINKYLEKINCCNIKTIKEFRKKLGGAVKTSDGQKKDPLVVNFLQHDSYDEIEDKRKKYYSSCNEEKFAKAVCVIYHEKENKIMRWEEFYEELKKKGIHKIVTLEDYI